MNNNDYLNKLKPIYNSLLYFDIKDNYLILTTNKTFILKLIHTDLSQINPDIFLAEPGEIFHFIQMNELLYKSEINEKEIIYIKDFTSRYLKIKQKNNEGNEINNITLWCLELLISKSFNEEFINNPASKIITSLIEEDNEKIKSGLNTGLRLVLTKESDPTTNNNNIRELEKAGFTTIILISLTIILTCIYFINFVINH